MLVISYILPSPTFFGGGEEDFVDFFYANPACNQHSKISRPVCHEKLRNETHPSK